MAQGSGFKTTLLHGTVLLCVPLLLSLPHHDAQAAPQQYQTAAQPQVSGMNAYRARRIKARAESYQERKQFPKQEIQEAEQPPEPAQIKHAEPLRVTIPHIVASPAVTPQAPRIVTRSAPAYKELANTGIAPDMQDVPITKQLAEAGSAVTSTIGKAGRSLLSAVLPASQEQAAPEVSLPEVQLAETKNPETIPAPIAPLPAAKAADDTPPPKPDEKPFRYYSPGIVIKKEVVRLPAHPEALASASPEQLARLAPAAGEPAAGVDAPLIQVPSTTETVEKQAQEALPAPPATSAQPLPELKPLTAPAAPPLPAAPFAAPAELPSPIVQPPTEVVEPIVPLVAPAVQAPPAEVKAEPAPQPVEPKQENIVSAPVADPAIASPPAAPEKQTLPAEQAISEIPQREETSDLSPGSKKILKKLPVMADEKPKEPKGLDIDRSKETQNLFEAGVQEQGAESEMPGVKIEVKAPSMNIDYELEKAYNALLSGQNSAAIEIYKAVLINEPMNEDALFGLATTYHRAGQIEAARPLYGKLLAKNPTHRAALNNFLVLVADEAPQDALIQLEALEQKSPDFSPIPAQMAVIYQKIGDFTKASDKMFKAVRLAPENLTYRYNLAILMDKQQNYDEASKLYGQIVQAHARGEATPGNINAIQERLTFLRSNKH